MPRSYRIERDAVIQRWYGGNSQPRNPRPRRSWEKGPITPADCLGIPTPVNSPFILYGHCMVWKHGLNRDGYGVLTIDERQELVEPHCCIDGYRDLSLMRASSVVKRQST